MDFDKIIVDFEDENWRSNGEEIPDFKQWPTVHPNDTEPVSIIDPDMDSGPWIAGGAALRWYQNLSVGENDIDVFCSNARQANKIISDIKRFNRYHIKHQSENAVTIDYHRRDKWEDKWTIQVITRKYFDSLQSVIDSFDITVCEIGTAGQQWMMNKETARDIRSKTLRLKKPYNPDSVKRLTKYWIYGYRPAEGTLDDLVDNDRILWKFNETGEYENAF